MKERRHLNQNDGHASLRANFANGIEKDKEERGFNIFRKKNPVDKAARWLLEGYKPLLKQQNPIQRGIEIQTWLSVIETEPIMPKDVITNMESYFNYEESLELCLWLVHAKNLKLKNWGIHARDKLNAAILDEESFPTIFKKNPTVSLMFLELKDKIHSEDPILLKWFQHFSTHETAIGDKICEKDLYTLLSKSIAEMDLLQLLNSLQTKSESQLLAEQMLMFMSNDADISIKVLAAWLKDNNDLTEFWKSFPLDLTQVPLSPAFSVWLISYQQGMQKMGTTESKIFGHLVELIHRFPSPEQTYVARLHELVAVLVSRVDTNKKTAVAELMLLSDGVNNKDLREFVIRSLAIANFDPLDAINVFGLDKVIAAGTSATVVGELVINWCKYIEGYNKLAVVQFTVDKAYKALVVLLKLTDNTIINLYTALFNSTNRNSIATGLLNLIIENKIYNTKSSDRFAALINLNAMLHL
ncbi:hypothetical protein CCR75_002601 [Bremia lactucae]|uniref:Uncharacterized protein n=1 Tax=Bremia lactucae TaxID=4779 RepID=A0A976ILB6_BRELC|nr:hypothetical protein CCR75_002601 [Bremia lactucae]